MARLRNAGLREDDYIQERSRVAIRSQIVDATADGFVAPKVLVDALKAYRYENRDINYLLLTNANIEPVKAPDDTTLAAWFETTKSGYRAPEYRSFTYVKLEPSDIADTSAITDEQIREDYERRKATYEIAGTRTIEQLSFENREMAEAALQELEQLVAQLDAGRQIAVALQDGFEGLKPLLPPPPSATGSKRAVVLIDPSYEIKSDYGKVSACIQELIRRFPTGTYLVWYPIIPRPEAHDLPRRLKTLSNQAQRPWLNATLAIGQDPTHGPDDRPGLTASGMFVINPPHTLKAALQVALPQLLTHLGRGRGKGQTLDTGG